MLATSFAFVDELILCDLAPFSGSCMLRFGIMFVTGISLVFALAFLVVITFSFLRLSFMSIVYVGGFQGRSSFAIGVFFFFRPLGLNMCADDSRPVLLVL